VAGLVVVGDYLDSNAESHGFIYNGSNFTGLDDPLGTAGTFVTGIAGTTIVGYYDSSTLGFNGFIAKPVPEPASASLVCVGIAALLRRRRRR
jgi:hypothetical protein